PDCRHADLTQDRDFVHAIVQYFAPPCFCGFGRVEAAASDDHGDFPEGKRRDQHHPSPEGAVNAFACAGSELWVSLGEPYDDLSIEDEAAQRIASHSTSIGSSRSTPSIVFTRPFMKPNSVCG